MSKEELKKLWAELDQEDEADKLEFKEIKISLCSQSKNYLVNKSWIPYNDAEDLIIQEATKKIINPENIPLELSVEYGGLRHYKELQFKPGLDQDITIVVKTPDEVYEIPATVSFTLCPKVAKKGTEYFEGDFQLRGSQKLIERAKELLIKGGCHINKVTEQPGGVDLKCTSKQVMRKVGKKLCQEFVGEFKESPRLFSRDHQTSKDIYRLNCMFKEMDWKIGDVVDVNGEQVKITTIGRRPYGKSLETGKKVYIN